ncbi:MAG: hypothetical protein CMJ83_17115 [Planctomycetes bacterium]|nr:hypothetical protein [Planctomycetota bacterium]
MARIRIATRRQFMVDGLGLVAAGAGLSDALLRDAVSGPREPGHRVVVILQLSGGHDTLSALVPYGHEEYGRVRKATRIGEKEVLKLDDELGLHPALGGFKDLLDDGAFAVIPGTGYPSPNYSHFKAMDIWHMADRRGRRVPYGWIGRYLDDAFEGSTDPCLSLAIGAGRCPPALVGKEHPGLSFSRPDRFRYMGDRGDKRQGATYRKLNELPATSTPANLEFVARTAAAANASSARIRELVAAYKPRVPYPNTRLGRSLRTVAALISGGMSTRAYHVSQGGFDTHAGQRTRHDELMTRLNAAVVAFQKDLNAQNQAKRVLTFTFSEFGRRVKENGSKGTDHGAAGSMFLFGPGVKPGIHGKHPSLTDLQGGGGGSLKHTVDFRSVYATVLEKWFETKSEPLLGKHPLSDCIA